MVVIFSNKVDELYKLVRPYTDKMGILKEDAPAEIKKAHQKLMKLMDEEMGD